MLLGAIKNSGGEGKRLTKKKEKNVLFTIF